MILKAVVLGILGLAFLAAVEAIGVIIALLCIPEDEHERELADRDQLECILKWREKNN